MQAKIITGDTYVLRKEIKYLFGARWHQDLKGWIPRRQEGLEDYVKAHNLELEDIEVPDDFFREYSTEELKEIRKEKLLKKADILEARASIKSRDSGIAREKADRIADIIPFGQPVLVGHHSEKRHRRDVDTIHNQTGKAISLSHEAEELKAKVARLRYYASGEQERPKGISTVTMDDLKRLKKDLGLYKATKRYHNHNKSGGNFAYNLYFDEEHSKGKSFELSGNHDTADTLTSLDFGYLWQVGTKVPKENFKDYPAMVEYLKGIITKALEAKP